MGLARSLSTSGALLTDKSLPSGSLRWARVSDPGLCFSWVCLFMPTYVYVWSCRFMPWQHPQGALTRDTFKHGVNWVWPVRRLCGRPVTPVGWRPGWDANRHKSPHSQTGSLGFMLEDKRWGTKGGGDMMDDREEHGGRSAHSSVGGIYRSNRTVSTCLCHLPECACGDSPCRLRRRLVGTGYARKCFVWERSLFSPCVGIVCISSPLPLMIYDIYFLPCSLRL